MMQPISWIAPKAKNFSTASKNAGFGPGAIRVCDTVDASTSVSNKTTVVVVSAQKVDKTFLSQWKSKVVAAVGNDEEKKRGDGGEQKQLLTLIRRGTSLGSIDLKSAKELGIQVYSTPGVNSPHVARFAVGRLGLLLPNNNDAKKSSMKKVVVVGAGSVGKLAIQILNKEAGIVPVVVTQTSMKFKDSSSFFHDELGARYGLNSDQAFFSFSLEDALNGATHVLVCSATNGSEPLIHEKHVQLLLRNSSSDAGSIKVCCISRPEVFSFEALKLLTRAAAEFNDVECTFDYGPGIIKPMKAKVFKAIKEEEQASPELKLFMAAVEKKTSWTSDAMSSEECKRDMDQAVFELLKKRKSKL